MSKLLQWMIAAGASVSDSPCLSKGTYKGYDSGTGNGFRKSYFLWRDWRFWQSSRRDGDLFSQA